MIHRRLNGRIHNVQSCLSDMNQLIRMDVRDIVHGNSLFHNQDSENARIQIHHSVQLLSNSELSDRHEVIKGNITLFHLSFDLLSFQSRFCDATSVNVHLLTSCSDVWSQMTNFGVQCRKESFRGSV
jgi:hypothetical protein